MGLDMYLYKRTYVKNWDHYPKDERHHVTVRKGTALHPEIKPERVCYIIEQVAYWRKANAIHRWFVENVQDGNDNCGEHYLERDQIESLVNLCKEVLSTVETVEGDVSTGTSYYPDGRVEHHSKRGPKVAQVSIAEDKLPTQSGFFFGGTEYDEYYLEDLKQTVKMLEPLLDETEGDFYYRSSW